MNLLRRFFGRRSRRAGHIAAKQVFIVDANGFIDKRDREANGLPSPRDNFYVLKNLAGFAQREGIEMTAVFIGRPLREAGEGKSFKTVTVGYAADDKTLSQKISELVRGLLPHTEVVVITDDRPLEREAMKLGAQCMRLTTLKKGMQGGFEHDRQPRQNQGKVPVRIEMEPPDADENAPLNDKRPPKTVLDLIDPI